MNAPFSLFLALRYLKPKRTFVSLITLISIAGVTLGIMVLILVISVMTGFDKELRRKVLGFDAHILITGGGVLENWRTLDEKVQKLPHVVATAPFVQGPVIAEYQNRRLAPKIRGIDLEREEAVTNIRHTIVEGEFDLAMDESGEGNKVVIGRELADSLGIGVGDKLTVYSPGNLSEIVEELRRSKQPGQVAKPEKDLEQMILPAELTVTGIFQSGRYIYDSEFLLVPLHIGQELYGLGDGLHGISIRTDDPYGVSVVQEELRPLLYGPFESPSWIDLNRALFDAIQMERNTLFFILLFIIIVAAFGIMNTLITVTVQKTREIGIMKALGANTGQIVWVFLTQGMVVGLFGNITGLAMGMTLVRWRNEFKEFLAQAMGIELFPASVYQFSQIPAEVVPRDVVVICLSAFMICSLAALIPAYFAARLDPVKALRSD